MFYLRLARGYRVLDVGRWILTAAASAAAAALLLRALGRALTDPPDTAAAVSLARLYWCLPPLAAIGWLVASFARALPGQRPERIAGLVAAGAGPTRIRLLIAGETALACAIGSLLALIGFLLLRNDIAGQRLAPPLGMGAHLPAAAALTLLLPVPLLGAVAAVAAVPIREALPGQAAGPAARTADGPLRIISAGAAILVGAAVELYGSHRGGRELRVPARLGSTTAVTGAGWALALLGLAWAVPPLLSWSGRLLAVGRPHAVRLLAGRGLQAEAGRLAVPLGLFAPVVAVSSVAAVRWAEGRRPGTLPLLDTALVCLCVAGAVATRLIELRTARRSAVAPVRRLGASAGVLRAAVLLRAAVVGAVVLSAAAASAGLTAVALHG